jgi:quercetin dioxygenase-like cupin family protein
MPELVPAPRLIPVAERGKTIEEIVGLVNNKEKRLSLARMIAEPGWIEPFQTPEFDEYTVVTSGAVVVETATGTLIVEAGQTVLCKAGERVRYSAPSGAEYLALCLPAFTPETVHREKVAD